VYIPSLKMAEKRTWFK